MPYIDRDDRFDINQHVDALALQIRDLARKRGHEAAWAGYLNYACTRLLLKVLPERRYWSIALASGVFQNVISEFYRRFAAPYEDEQRKKHGDVYPRTPVRPRQRRRAVKS